jgi:hypothetical protein
MKTVSNFLNAIKDNEIEKVNSWLLCEPEVINAVDYDGRSGLHIAGLL